MDMTGERNAETWSRQSLLSIRMRNSDDVMTIEWVDSLVSKSISRCWRYLREII